MTYIFPTTIYCTVVHVSAGMTAHAEGSTVRSSESFNLVLRADAGANIILCTSERLSEVDVHLTFSTRWRTGPEIDDDLTDRDVGFLSHSHGEGSTPFVGGGALLLQTSVLASLLIPGVTGTVKLVLPTVPFEQDNERPYVWKHDRPHMLRVSNVEVSAIRPDTAEKNDG